MKKLKNVMVIKIRFEYDYSNMPHLEVKGLIKLCQYIRE